MRPPVSRSTPGAYRDGPIGPHGTGHMAPVSGLRGRTRLFSRRAVSPRVPSYRRRRRCRGALAASRLPAAAGRGQSGHPAPQHLRSWLDLLVASSASEGWRTQNCSPPISPSPHRHATRHPPERASVEPPGCQGLPRRRSRNRSSPIQPALRHASTSSNPTMMKAGLTPALPENTKTNRPCRAAFSLSSSPPGADDPSPPSAHTTFQRGFSSE
jgi:hypothetical protein